MRKTEIEETNMTDINKIENGPMLNLYPDSLGGDLEAVADLFERDGFADAFSSMYILPSIYHSDHLIYLLFYCFCQTPRSLQTETGESYLFLFYCIKQDLIAWIITGYYRKRHTELHQSSS
jgi:hypothetical protein